MSSRQGRGAQVRLDPDHRAVARGGSGRSLLDNIIAKRSFEDSELGADGGEPDGSFGGNEALDYVLTPGGRLQGGVVAPPAGPGQLRSAIAAGSGLSADLRDAGSAVPGAMRTAIRASSALDGGALRGAGALASSASASSALAARLGGLGALRSDTGSRSALTADLSGPGPLASTIEARSRFGSGMFTEIRARSGLSATLTGIGALANGERAEDPANSGNPSNSGDAANAAGSILPSPRASSGLSTRLSGVGGLRSAIAAASDLSAALAGTGGAVVGPDTVLDRDGRAVTLRDGNAVRLRPTAGEGVVDRNGAPIALRDGRAVLLRPSQAIVVADRAGAPVALRDGRRIELRTQPDPPPVVVPPPEPEPEPEPDQPPQPVVWPTGPHLRLRSLNAACVIKSQDGLTADIRLVRPLYAGTAYIAADVHGTSATPQSIWIAYHWERFQDTNGEIWLRRDLNSEDDGSYEAHIGRALSDGTSITVDIVIRVAASAAIADPQPTPAPSKAEAVYLEDWDYGRGLGAFTKTYQGWRIEHTTGGELILDGSARDGGDQPSTLMMMPNALNVNDGVLGLPNGRHELRARIIGTEKGPGSGPCALLWPANDVWTSEVDLLEVWPDGRLYTALHRRNPDDASKDQALIWIWSDEPRVTGGLPFDNQAWHVVCTECFADVFRVWVDGKLLAEVTDPAWLPKDYLHGGVDHTMGAQVFDSPTRLVMDAYKFTPEALVPAGAYVPFRNP